jgi:hypothetical protein
MSVIGPIPHSRQASEKAHYRSPLSFYKGEPPPLHCYEGDCADWRLVLLRKDKMALKAQ